MPFYTHKPRIIFQSTFFFSLLLSATHIQSQEHREFICEQLNISGPNEWPPVSYIDRNTDKHRGIGYELFEVIASRQHIPYKVIAHLPWKRVLKYSEETEIDLIVAIYQNSTREAFLEFSEPYFQSTPTVYVVKGKEFNFNGMTDLVGKKGLKPFGASYGETFDTFATQLDLQGTSDKQELFWYLLKGNVDYAIQDQHEAEVYLKHNHLKDKIVSLSEPIANLPVRFAYSLNSRCQDLLNKFKQGFEEMRLSGELAQRQRIKNTSLLSPQLIKTP